MTLLATLVIIYIAAIGATVLPLSPKGILLATSTSNFLLSGVGLAIGLLQISSNKATQVAIHFGDSGMALTYSISNLGALFLILLSFIAMTTVAYGATQNPNSAVVSTNIARSTFIFSMMTVVFANNGLAFTLGWELMTLSSALLVVSDVKKYPSAKSALTWYLSMSQVSAVSLILGFSTFSSSNSKGNSLWLASFTTISPKAVSPLAIGLLLLAFAIKMGLFPLHVWLPKAHPAAPAEISALMSGAMVAIGVYGMVLTLSRLDGAASIYFGEGLIVIGAITAVYSIIKAAVEDDLKVLLAQSTSENMGLIAIAIGTYLCALRSHEIYVANSALLATILLTFAHAFFKQGLFMAAGSIYRASKTKSINDLGGIGGKMKFTTATFAVGAIGATALPPSLAFVAEWLLLQTLSHATTQSATVPTLLKILFPVAVAAIALTTGLAVVTFTKIVGVAILGTARSESTSRAKEVPKSEWITPLLASSATIVPALAIGLVTRLIDRALSLHLSLSPQSLFTLRVPLFRASITPIAIFILLVAVMTSLWIISRLLSRRFSNQTVEIPWGCGAVAIDPIFQSNASGFAEPVLRIFDDVINPGKDLEVSHSSESTYISQRHLRATLVSTDMVEERLIRPLIKVTEKVALKIRTIQGGSIHLYLIYALIGLIAVIALSSI